MAPLAEATLVKQALPEEAAPEAPPTPAAAVASPPAPSAAIAPTAPSAAPAPPAAVAPPAPSAPPVPPGAVATRTRSGRIDRPLALWLGIGGPAITAINIAIEPLPADPNAPVPAVATILFLAYTVAVVATAVYGARRETRALPTAAAVGVLAVVLTVTCPMSGHHAGIGWWWYTQMALSAGFLGLALTGWRRHHRPA